MTMTLRLSILKMERVMPKTRQLQVTAAMTQPLITLTSRPLYRKMTMVRATKVVMRMATIKKTPMARR